MLITADAELLSSDLAGRQALKQALGADVPADWPPEGNDANVLGWMRGKLVVAPDELGWWPWYVLLQGDPRAAAGLAGFKGPPTAGTAEIGYSVVESLQRRGIATEAVGALISWALDHESVQTVIAHTLADNVPSIRVLEKLGFERAGVNDEGELRFVLEQ